jgi:hypothetical protein
MSTNSSQNESFIQYKTGWDEPRDNEYSMYFVSCFYLVCSGPTHSLRFLANFTLLPSHKLGCPLISYITHVYIMYPQTSHTIQPYQFWTLTTWMNFILNFQKFLYITIWIAFMDVLSSKDNDIYPLRVNSQFSFLFWYILLVYK